MMNKRNGRDESEKNLLHTLAIITSLYGCGSNGKGEEDQSWKTVQRRRWQDAMTDWTLGLNEREE